MSVWMVAVSAVVFAAEPTADVATDCSYSMEQFDADRAQARASVLEEEDLDGFQPHADAIASGVGCLTELMNYSSWADHLVVVAIVRHDTNEDWQSALANALRAHPTVDRVVGEDHPIYQWKTGASPVESSQVHPALEVYLDGRLVSFLPSVSGPSLIQVVVDEEVHSRYFEGPLDAEWVAGFAPPAPIEPAPAVEVLAPVAGVKRSPPGRSAGVGLAVGGGAVALAGGVVLATTYVSAGSGTGTAADALVTRELAGLGRGSRDHRGRGDLGGHPPEAAGGNVAPVMEVDDVGRQPVRWAKTMVG